MIEQFLSDLFTMDKREGLLVIHVLVSACMFVALAILYDDYFVPCLEKIREGKDRRERMAEDVQLQRPPLSRLRSCLKACALKCMQTRRRECLATTISKQQPAFRHILDLPPPPRKATIYRVGKQNLHWH